MKAEEILNAHGLNEHNCLAYKEIIDCLEDYARIQIEKYLDIVKTKFNSNPLQTLEYVLESTPINLD